MSMYAGLKYIAYRQITPYQQDYANTEDKIIVFDQALKHSDVEMMLNRGECRVIDMLGAGFVYGGQCWGESESMGVKAREAEDTVLYQAMLKELGVIATPQKDAVLLKCRDTFRKYTLIHKAKGTDDGQAKAEANLALAHEVEAVLEVPHER